MRKALCVLCVIGGLPASASVSWAHVKWFAPFQTAEQPLALGGMFAAMWGSVVLVTLGFWAACYVETTRAGRSFLGGCHFTANGLYLRIDDLLRGGTAVFFGALSAQGSFILTPDLKSTVAWVPIVQAAIAIGMFWRQTLPLSALGVLILVVYSGMVYGIFHLLDYSVFLGLAAFFVLLVWNDPKVSAYRFDIVRFSLALSLMWAGVEKWAYPQWTEQILQAHPHLALGGDVATYIAFAGAVEFGLAFALLWTPAVRCAAALVLVMLMGAAIYEFGNIDALGHLPIIIILVAVVAEGARNRTPSAARGVMLAPVAKGLALVSVVFSYNAAHRWFVGSQSPQVTATIGLEQRPEEHPHHVAGTLAVQPVKESAPAQLPPQ